MSATLGDTHIIEEGLQKLTGSEVVSVRQLAAPGAAGLRLPRDAAARDAPGPGGAKGKYPIYLVNFTQRAAAEQAQNLMSVDFCTKEEKEAIRQALMDAPFDTPYGKEFQRFLRHGVGMHHAGLLPKYRLLVEKLAQEGHLKVISGTDTLGVGVNIPIRTVLFTQLFKFNGEKLATLSVRDFKQIAGRAGRKGFDDEGSVVAQAPEHVVENIKQAAEGGGGQEEGAQGQAAAEGLRPLRQEHLRAAAERHARAAGVALRGVPRPAAQPAAERHDGGQRRLPAAGAARRAYARLGLHEAQAPEDGGHVLPDAAGRGHRRRWRSGRGHAVVKVAEDLQRDFSLNHTLSLYLLDTLEKLDPTLETYALDVVTLVESILENPEVVLYAQLHQLKGEKIAEMKAQGMEYDDRMEELEKLEWPKPNRDFIYGTFNAVRAEAPVGGAGEHPAQVHRAGHVRALHVLPRLRARVRPAAQRGRAAAVRGQTSTRRWCRRCPRASGTRRWRTSSITCARRCGRWTRACWTSGSG